MAPAKGLRLELFPPEKLVLGGYWACLTGGR